MKVKDWEITFIESNQATRELGVYITPYLKWITQYKKIKEKMVIAIMKVNNMEILPHRMHLYFNSYLIKCKFFRCRIVKLNKKTVVRFAENTWNSNYQKVKPRYYIPKSYIILKKKYNWNRTNST